MKKISWSKTATKSYIATLEYLVEQGAQKAALKLDSELLKRLAVLKEFPKTGIVTAKRNARKLILAKNYFVIYTELKNSIFIISFIDSRSDHPY